MKSRTGSRVVSEGSDKHVDGNAADKHGKYIDVSAMRCEAQAHVAYCESVIKIPFFDPEKLGEEGVDERIEISHRRIYTDTNRARFNNLHRDPTTAASYWPASHAREQMPGADRLRLHRDGLLPLQWENLASLHPECLELRRASDVFRLGEEITQDVEAPAGANAEEFFAKVRASAATFAGWDALNPAIVTIIPRGGRVQYRLVFELPKELNDAQTVALAYAIAKYLDSLGVVFSLAVHKPDQHNDERNVHLHAAIGDRPAVFDEQQSKWVFAKKKVRIFNGDHPRLGIRAVRKALTDLNNEALLQAGKSSRYDARNYAELGIDKVPDEHLGNDRAYLESRGEATDAGIRNAEHCANAEAKRRDAELESRKKHRLPVLARAWEQIAAAEIGDDARALLRRDVSSLEASAAKANALDAKLTGAELIYDLARSRPSKVRRTCDRILVAISEDRASTTDVRAGPDLLARKALAGERLDEIEKIISAADILAVRKQIEALDQEIRQGVAALAAGIMPPGERTWDQESARGKPHPPAFTRTPLQRDAGDIVRTSVIHFHDNDEQLARNRVANKIKSGEVLLHREASGSRQRIVVVGLSPEDQRVLDAHRDDKGIRSLLHHRFEYQEREFGRLRAYRSANPSQVDTHLLGDEQTKALPKAVLTLFSKFGDHPEVQAWRQEAADRCRASTEVSTSEAGRFVRDAKAVPAGIRSPETAQAERMLQAKLRKRFKKHEIPRKLASSPERRLADAVSASSLAVPMAGQADRSVPVPPQPAGLANDQMQVDRGATNASAQPLPIVPPVELVPISKSANAAQVTGDARGRIDNVEAVPRSRPDAIVEAGLPPTASAQERGFGREMSRESSGLDHAPDEPAVTIVVGALPRDAFGDTEADKRSEKRGRSAAPTELRAGITSNQIDEPRPESAERVSVTPEVAAVEIKVREAFLDARTPAPTAVSSRADESDDAISITDEAVLPTSSSKPERGSEPSSPDHVPGDPGVTAVVGVLPVDQLKGLQNAEHQRTSLQLIELGAELDELQESRAGFTTGSPPTSAGFDLWEMSERQMGDVYEPVAGHWPSVLLSGLPEAELRSDADELSPGSLRLLRGDDRGDHGGIEVEAVLASPNDPSEKVIAPDGPPPPPPQMLEKDARPAKDVLAERKDLSAPGAVGNGTARATRSPQGGDVIESTPSIELESGDRAETKTDRGGLNLEGAISTDSGITTDNRLTGNGRLTNTRGEADQEVASHADSSIGGDPTSSRIRSQSAQIESEIVVQIQKSPHQCIRILNDKVELVPEAFPEHLREHLPEATRSDAVFIAVYDIGLELREIIEKEDQEKERHEKELSAASASARLIDRGRAH